MSHTCLTRQRNEQESEQTKVLYNRLIKDHINTSHQVSKLTIITTKPHIPQKKRKNWNMFITHTLPAVNYKHKKSARQSVF